jgi:hypothetical protein
MDLERALRRPGEHFLEDGLWEIAMGLWMGLTVAVPQFIGGAAAEWSPVLMMLASLAIRPLVTAAKSRWVDPRAGRVTFPEHGAASLGPIVLGLGPAARPAVGDGGPGKLLLRGLLAAPVAAAIVVSLIASRRQGLGDAGGHMMLGLVLGASLLFGAWRWRQRRWIALGIAFPLLGALVASSGLGRERALALHAAGIATAILLSGTTAFVAHLLHAPGPAVEADGR